MRYDIQREWFRSPRGRSVLVYVREGTNDHNTAQSCLNEDEYRTRDLHLSGLAVDIGGFLGTVALALLIDNPALRVIVVEPIPENLDMIRRNLTVNGVADRAQVIAGAVGVSGEPVTISYAFQGEENELHHAFVGNAATVGLTVEHKEVTYPALGLADIVPDGPVPYLKIDCEGGEWGFLTDPGVARIERIVGEFHPILQRDGTTGSRARLEELLSPTHDVTYPDAESWGFTAIRR